MEQIGPLLFDLLQGLQLSITEQADYPLRDLLSQVSAETNIDFRNYKSSTIVRRISRRMAVTHVANIRDYTEYIQTHPDEIHELVKAFLIKVTGFFRDPEAFKEIQETIIPDLIERGRGNGRTIRLWSAGCSTGEEPYSLALLLADQLNNEFPQWNIKIFATDLAAESLAFARRGLYPENVLMDLPEDYRVRFFEKVEQGYRVSKSLRQAIIFGQQDISKGVPFPRIDLVTCRNLLIYLKPDLQQTVLDLFAYSLSSTHGYLFLGKAETTRPTKATFELVNKKWKIYRCLGGPVTLPLQESMRAGVSGSSEARHRHSSSPSSAVDVAPPELEVTQIRRINETLLRSTHVAIVVIDRSYRIVTMNAAARRLLGVHDLAYDQDFLHTVRGLPYQEVRRAIDTVFREHSTIALPELELDPASEPTVQYVNFTLTPMQAEQGSPQLVVITALDATNQVQIRRRLEAVQREHTDLVNELSATNKRLGPVNRELQDANEELQTTNDELTARTIELQDLTQQHRIEQWELSTVLERFPHYAMVLNAEDFTIHAVNSAYKQLLGARDVITLPLTEVFAGNDMEDFINALRQSVKKAEVINTAPFVASVRGMDSNALRFVHTIIPISDSTGGKINRLFVYSEGVRED
jgi:two-component system CheB/CheR fusion protein